MPEPRYVPRKTNGAYGEWEVWDRFHEQPVVPYAWFTKQEAQKACDSEKTTPEAYESEETL